MIINWYGEGSFKIQTSGTTILVDPFEKESGLTPPRFSADIVLKTLTAWPVEVSNEVIGEGEYEIKGIEINGWQAAKESDGKTIKSVYLVRAEDLRLCFLGYISQIPESEIVEKLDDIDILFIPGGGSPYLEQEAAVKFVKQLQPKIVIPTHFKVSGLKRKADDVKEFLKEIEQKAEPEEKLTVKKKDLADKTKVVVLKI